MHPGSGSRMLTWALEVFFWPNFDPINGPTMKGCPSCDGKKSAKEVVLKESSTADSSMCIKGWIVSNPPSDVNKSQDKIFHKK